jgi:hypothetical protein
MVRVKKLIDSTFRPARSAFDEVTATLGTVRDPSAAWKLLIERGLLPASWLDEPKRRFPALGSLPAHERYQRLRRAPYIPLGPHPDDLDTCALLAADVRGIETAEEQGFLLCSAWSLWGYPESKAVLWVPSSLSGYGYQLHDTKPGVWEPDGFLWQVFPKSWEEVCKLRDFLSRESGDNEAHHAARAVAGWLYGHQLWTACVERGGQVPSDAPPAVAGRLYAELPNPFATALRIFEAGYAPLPSGNGLLVLGYPELERRPRAPWPERLLGFWKTARRLWRFGPLGRVRAG